MIPSRLLRKQQSIQKIDYSRTLLHVLDDQPRWCRILEEDVMVQVYELTGNEQFTIISLERDASARRYGIGRP